MRTVLTLVALLALIAGSGVAKAACSTSSPNTGVTPIGQYYLDDRGPGSLWLYQESNNIGGLQRGGCSSYTGECDPCTTDPVLGHDKLIL